MNTLSSDSLSTTGYIFTLDSGAISWKCKKQTIIANSTMEAELIALDLASEEANWLRDFLYEIPLWEKPIPPILIYCNSTATIDKVKKPLLQQYIQIYKKKAQYNVILFE